jgi:hypothetical protein
MYWYILAYFLNSGVFSYRLVLFWIRGGTRRYKAVPESPVPLDIEVQGGTRPCTFMYFLVPAYPGVQDFLVLPCTSLYQFHCLVPPCTASYPEEDKRIQGGMTVYQNGHPGMFQFVSEYSNKGKYV